MLVWDQFDYGESCIKIDRILPRQIHLYTENCEIYIEV